MELKAWMWNLGMVAVVSTTGACKDGKAEDDCYSTPGGYSFGCYEEEYEDYEYEQDHEDEHDDYDDYDEEDDDPVCSDDGDCALGVCVSPGQREAYCSRAPAIPICVGAPQVQLTWVRQGTGAGVGVGVAGRVGEPQRVLLVGADIDGVEVPLSVSDLEVSAVPDALPLEPAEVETVTGIEQADLDADGDFDLLVTLSGDEQTRVVPVLSEADGTTVALDPVVFDAAAGGSKLRRLEDGTFSLFVHSNEWELLQSASIEGGGFAEPTASPWESEHVVDYALAPLEDQTSDAVLVTVLTDANASIIEAVLGGVRVALGLAGAPERRVFADSSAGFVVTVDTTRDDLTTVESAFVGDDVAGRMTLAEHESDGVLEVAMTDMNGDGQGELVLLHGEGRLTVVYSASSEDACVQTVVTGTEFDAMLTPASGTGEGVVLSGPEGVLSARSWVD